MPYYQINEIGRIKIAKHLQRVLKHPETSTSWADYIVDGWNSEKHANPPTTVAMFDGYYKSNIGDRDYYHDGEDYYVCP